jgi:hypothetical protein
MASWNTLHREIQYQIFHELTVKSSNDQRYLGKCASVCRDWQYAFEPFIFQTLTLSQSCLKKFRYIVWGEKSYRLNLIHILWLRIRLDEYDWSACQTAEDTKTIKKLVINIEN